MLDWRGIHRTAPGRLSQGPLSERINTVPIDVTDPATRAALRALRRHLSTTQAVLASPDPKRAEIALTASAREAHDAMRAAGLLGLPDDEVLAALDRLDA
jgi:hypothetical protein